MRRQTLLQHVPAALSKLLGVCTHQNITRPEISLQPRQRGIYVNCLDCAKRILYSNPEFLGGTDARCSLIGHSSWISTDIGK